MNYAVVYSSQTGNTRKLAETIKSVLSPEKCSYFGTVPSCILEKPTVVFAGFWTDKGNCAGDMASFLETLENQKVFLFGTAGFGQNQAYFDQILTKVSSHLPPSAELIGCYMCQGQMPDSVQTRYQMLLEKDPENLRIQGMLKNFRQAVGHPTQQELDALKAKLQELLNSL